MGNIGPVTGLGRFEAETGQRMTFGQYLDSHDVSLFGWEAANASDAFVNLAFGSSDNPLSAEAVLGEVLQRPAAEIAGRIESGARPLPGTEVFGVAEFSGKKDLDWKLPVPRYHGLETLMAGFALRARGDASKLKQPQLLGGPGPELAGGPKRKP